MSDTDTDDAGTLLARVLDADRALRRARETLIDLGDAKKITAAIGREVDRAFVGATDEMAAEAGARLLCISDLLVDIAGVEAAQLLVRILGHDEPAVRVAAGEALVELLYDRYAEVARVLEAEVDRNGNATALAEVPFILAEVGEPGGAKIMVKLLKHADPDVVGAAVEGLAALGDATAIKALEPLRDDARRVTVEDDAEGVGEVTVGDLASEAIDHLRKVRGS